MKDFLISAFVSILVSVFLKPYFIDPIFVIPQQNTFVSLMFFVGIGVLVYFCLHIKEIINMFREKP
ncbi:MAG: hypothetical protein CVV00_12520 [Firmicutes bacterium HGW-Firmicutes-5]|nr:MAG: hypothetical protein CVV00_12520 [Firmicutes bacterium HGW-Firmicutes-5]